MHSKEGDIPRELEEIIDRAAKEEIEAEMRRMDALRVLGEKGGIEVGEDKETEEQLLLKQAEELFKQGKYGEAIKAYRRIYEKYPDWEYAEYSLRMIGICYDWMGRVEESIQSYEKAVREYPDLKGFSDLTYFYLGEAYHKKGRSREAIEAFTRSIKLSEGVRDPDTFPCIEARRWILLTEAEEHYANKRYEEAIKAYQRIYEEHPDWNYAEHALSMIGICHGKMGQPVAAIKALEKAVREYPYLKGWTETTYLYLGDAYAGKGEVEKAIGAFKKCIKLSEGVRDLNGFPCREARERIAQLESGSGGGARRR